MKVTADDRLFEEIPGLCIGIIALPPQMLHGGQPAPENEPRHGRWRHRILPESF